jgi:hypothetical protein
VHLEVEQLRAQRANLGAVRLTRLAEDNTASAAVR